MLKKNSATHRDSVQRIEKLLQWKLSSSVFSIVPRRPSGSNASVFWLYGAVKNVRRALVFAAMMLIVQNFCGNNIDRFLRHF